MLPKLAHPTFETEIPSTKVKIKFRPLQVKEHKLLMSVVEFQDETNLIETFRTIIESCTFGQKISNLAMFDVEYLFLKIKGASTGSINTVKYTCNGKKEDGSTCGHTILLNLDTDLAKVDIKDVNRIIVLDSNGVGVSLKYPTFEEYVKRGGIDNINVLSEEFILDCVDNVFDKDNVYKMGLDYTREELKAFMDGISEEASNKILEFINNIPQVEMKVPIRCSKCGNNDTLHLRGLDDFLE